MAETSCRGVVACRGADVEPVRRTGRHGALSRHRAVDIDGQRAEGSTVMEVNYRRVEHSLIGARRRTTLYGSADPRSQGRGTVFILPVERKRSR